MNPEEIVRLRTQLMLGQADLATALGVTRPCVLLWESGQRKIPRPAQILLKLYVKYPGLLQEKM